MAKRKKRKYGNVLAFISEETQIEAEKSQNNELISIWEIRPDPNQPRSLLPSSLSAQFEAGALTPREVISAWAEYGNPAYESLQTLAQSIAQHGQINPISVRSAENSDEVKYIIITGERRWWAHVLLASENRQINEGETTRSADQIKVNITQKGVSIRAHQLIENLVREDLNIVEKARGMWALRYELSGLNHGSPLHPNQLNSRELVPWSQVEETLSISKRYRIYVTKVLKLCPEALELIQAHNLSERMIRPIVQKLRDVPTLQLKALNQLIAWQTEQTRDGESRSLVRLVKQFVDELLTPIPLKEELTLPVQTKVSSESQGSEPAPENQRGQPASEEFQRDEAIPFESQRVEPEPVPPERVEPKSSVTQAVEPVPVPPQKIESMVEEPERPSEFQPVEPVLLPAMNRYPAADRKITNGDDLLDIIMMTNSVGGTAWQFNHPRSIKLTVEVKKGEVQEYQLTPPHEGVLMLHFPKVK